MDLKYRQMLINVLIYKVYIYDDNITIIYNSNWKTIETKIPKQKELEKMFQVQKNGECSNKEKISQPIIEYLQMFRLFEITFVDLFLYLFLMYN